MACSYVNDVYIYSPRYHKTLPPQSCRMSKKRPWFDGPWMVRRIPKRAVLDCSHAGDCGDDVAFWVSKLGFDCPADEARSYLKGFGTWDDGELADHAANVRRVFWLFCGEIRERGKDFSSYLGE